MDKYYILTNFDINLQEIKYFMTNDLPYYILNINEELIKISNIPEKSNIIFNNLSEHFTNDSFDKLLLNEINEDEELKNLIKKNTKINLIKERTNLLSYINNYLNDDLYTKFKNNEIIEIPLFFIQSFYSKFKSDSFVIFKSKYLNKYIDCLYMYQIVSPSTPLLSKFVSIKSYDQFEKYFREEFNELIIKYSSILYSGGRYIDEDNFYGESTNYYMKQIEKFKQNLNKNV